MDTMTKEQAVDLAFDLLEASPFANLFFAFTESVVCHIKPDYEPAEDTKEALAMFKQVLVEQDGLATAIINGYLATLIEDTDNLRNQLESLIARVHVTKDKNEYND
jgi:hypothetical protein